MPQWFFTRGRRGRGLFPPALILLALILASSILTASYSMWSYRLGLEAKVKTGLFKATICKYRVSETRACGCDTNVTARTGMRDESLIISLDPGANTTICTVIVAVNNASIPVTLDGVGVDTALPHGDIGASYYGVFNSSTLCSCRLSCPFVTRLEAGVPMKLFPGEAAVILVSIHNIEREHGGDILVHVISHPSG
jgi:hypothetical protein